MSLYAEFDHYNLPIGPDGTPYEYLEALRLEVERTQTPIGWSEAHGGFWVVAGYEEDREIMMNSVDFSNEGCLFPRYGTGDAKIMLAEHDEPEHKKYRKLVQAPFSAAKVGEFEPALRASAIDLIERFIDDGEVDIVKGLGEDVPARLTAIILGLPPEDGDRYRRWTHAMAFTAIVDPPAAVPIVQEMYEYFDVMLAERRENLGEDILSLVMRSEADGERLTDHEIKEFWIALLIGGIHNTARLLGTVVWRLAWDRELRRRLTSRPELIEPSVHEIMRYYTPGLVGRLIVNETTVAGVTMTPGQHLILAHSLANRDGRVFPDPDVFIPERANANKHLGLGRGIHRCLGAHVVNLEIKIVLEELLARVPDFDLAPGKRPVWGQGQVAGMESVHIVFPPGGGHWPRAHGEAPAAVA
jgi:cytochrome P450